LNASYGIYHRPSCEYMEKPTVKKSDICIVASR
jgi:hypothetical protein